MKIEDAIKRYESWAEDDRIDVLIRKEHRQIADWLKELKTDRPQGKWIVRFPYKDTDKIRTCSNCNITQTVNVYDGVVRFKFCPYCGAMMKGTDGDL